MFRRVLLVLRWSVPVAALALSGCHRRVEASEETSVNGAEASQAALASADVPRPRFDEGAFRLSFEARGPYRAQSQANAVVVLQSKAPFHVNPDYPLRFKLSPNSRVTSEKTTFGRDAAKIQPAQAELTVSFVPTAKGKLELVGQLSFSVCTSEKCLVEKRQLKLDADVQ